MLSRSLWREWGVGFRRSIAAARRGRARNRVSRFCSDRERHVAPSPPAGPLYRQPRPCPDRRLSALVGRVRAPHAGRRQGAGDQLRNCDEGRRIGGRRASAHSPARFRGRPTQRRGHWTGRSSPMADRSPSSSGSVPFSPAASRLTPSPSNAPRSPSPRMTGIRAGSSRSGA